MNQRVTIFTGHFGSGKTELSIREAVESAKIQSTVLADLDIINTYFRSNEERIYMEERGVKVLAPRFATSQVDIPALTRVFLQLQKLGMDVKSVYTMEQAVDALRRVKEGNGNA